MTGIGAEATLLGEDSSRPALYFASPMLSDMTNKDAPGEVDLARLERAIGSHTELIAITHLPMQGL